MPALPPQVVYPDQGVRLPHQGHLRRHFHPLPSLAARIQDFRARATARSGDRPRPVLKPA